METDVPLSAIETDPFERILTRLQPSDDEYAVLDAKTNEMKGLLREALGPDYIVRDFGSYNRGTQLAKAVDPQRDVDLLIYMKLDAKHLRYSQSEEELRERFSRLTVATEPPAEPAFSEAESPDFREDPVSESDDFREVRIAIQSALEQSGCRVTVHNPFMTVEKDGDIFDLVLADQSDENYFALPLKASDVAGSLPVRLTHRYRGSHWLLMGVTPTGRRSYSVFTAPFEFNISTYNERYGFYWHAVVLTWKYWKVRNNARVNSWMIEYNVLKRLQSSRFHETLPREPMSFLAFVALYFGSRSNYHFELFKSEPGFLQFKRRLRQAAKAEQQGLFGIRDRLLSTLFTLEEPRSITVNFPRPLVSELHSATVNLARSITQE